MGLFDQQIQGNQGLDSLSGRCESGLLELIRVRQLEETQKLPQGSTKQALGTKCSR